MRLAARSCMGRIMLEVARVHRGLSRHYLLRGRPRFVELDLNVSKFRAADSLFAPVHLDTRQIFGDFRGRVYRARFGESFGSPVSA